MELNSVEDINVLVEYQKSNQIALIEKKLARLSYAPILICLVLIAWAVNALIFNDLAWSPVHMILIAVAIASVGHTNVQRTNLLKELFELKYGRYRQ